jgi:hypothetical protein
MTGHALLRTWSQLGGLPGLRDRPDAGLERPCKRPGVGGRHAMDAVVRTGLCCGGPPSPRTGVTAPRATR